MPRAEIEQVLQNAYGLALDASPKAGGLAAVASALNDGEIARAQLTALFLHFPDPDDFPSSLPLVAKAEGLRRGGLTTKDWNPDAHPRAGGPPNPGWFAPTAGAGGDAAPRESSISGEPGGVDVAGAFGRRRIIQILGSRLLRPKPKSPGEAESDFSAEPKPEAPVVEPSPLGELSPPRGSAGGPSEVDVDMTPTSGVKPTAEVEEAARQVGLRIADAESADVRPPKPYGGRLNTRFSNKFGWGDGEQGAFDAIQTLSDDLYQSLVDSGISRQDVADWRNFYVGAAAAGKGGNVSKLRAIYMQLILNRWPKGN